MGMVKSVTVPILNHEYKVVICWGDLKYLRKTLLDHYYNQDNVTMTMLERETENRRGVTFREHRCYPTIWLDADISAVDTMGTLAHEAVHAVDFIFQAVDEDMIHSEIFAHSVGAIVRETVKTMKILATPEEGKKAKGE